MCFLKKFEFAEDPTTGGKGCSNPKRETFPSTLRGLYLTFFGSDEKLRIF